MTPMEAVVSAMNNMLPVRAFVTRSGVWIPVTEIAAAAGVNRGQALKALWELEGLGAVKRLEGFGWRITEVKE